MTVKDLPQELVNRIYRLNERARTQGGRTFADIRQVQLNALDLGLRQLEGEYLEEKRRAS